MDEYELRGGPMAGWILRGHREIGGRTPGTITFEYRSEDRKETAELLREKMGAGTFFWKVEGSCSRNIG